MAKQKQLSEGERILNLFIAAGLIDGAKKVEQALEIVQSFRPKKRQRKIPVTKADDESFFNKWDKAIKSL